MSYHKRRYENEPTEEEFVESWTNKSVGKFWDHQRPEDFFAEQCGKRLVSMVHSSGKILDFGCGSGGLLPYLKGEIYAYDLSYNQRNYVRSTYPNVVVLDTPVGTFDTIFCLEVIEHVLELEKTLEILFGLLNSQGRLIITTPNDEDLAVSSMACPECGTHFHRWQHVRSWDIQSLSNALIEAGFKPYKVFTCDLYGNALERMYRRMKGKKHPNLVAIVTK